MVWYAFSNEYLDMVVVVIYLQQVNVWCSRYFKLWIRDSSNSDNQWYGKGKVNECNQHEKEGIQIQSWITVKWVK